MIGPVEGPLIKPYLTSVSLEDVHKDPDGCRFSRTVPAQETENLAGSDGEGHVFQDMEVIKILVDIPKLQLHRRFPRPQYFWPSNPIQCSRALDRRKVFQFILKMISTVGEKNYTPRSYNGKAQRKVIFYVYKDEGIGRSG